MKAEQTELNEFISRDRTFVIPVYQRNYDWRKENCERLFEDLLHSIETKKPHFIGTFVYQEIPGANIFKEFVIIDGQQRITSIILLAKAIYELSADERWRKNLYSVFIKHSDGELEGKYKLRPNEYDRATFEKLISDDVFDENNFTTQEKDCAMYRNYLFFREKLAASEYNPKEFYTAVAKLNIVRILLDEENPQEIFESLNSTGLALSPADLIRNFLLMPLDYDLQEELYKKYWLEIETLLHSSDSSNNLERFLIQYLIVKCQTDIAMGTKKKKLSSSYLYDTFKRFCKEEFGIEPSKKDPAAVEACLKDLRYYARFFSRVIFNGKTVFKNLSALDKKFYELTYILQSDNVPIILMYLLDRYERNHFDEAAFIGFVDALISLTFRAKICGNNGANAQFAGNVIARLDNDKENSLSSAAFWRALTFGRGKYAFPGDDEFQTALANNSLYEKIKSPLCKYLLYSLERATGAKELPPYSETSIEHILPQKWSDSWRKYLAVRNDLQAHEVWLHALGNLTLTPENSNRRNADFNAKKEIYQHSDFYYTRALNKYHDWTSLQIQARTKKLSAAALKVWTLPEEFNTAIKSTANIFYLDSDFNDCTNHKPATYSFAGETKPVSDWTKLTYEVAKLLYTLDEENFSKAMQKDNVPKRRGSFSTEPTKFKISEGLYMFSRTCDTVSCLKILKALVENFDQLTDTNFKEDFYFTLRQA